ncbi:hypothetical protein, partial [Klebsiella aerogenes]|uniref:hypothetical protein n=1 Tax=Klebsiella aerogenes TaxID=548 RepID=UPI001CBB5154
EHRAFYNDFSPADQFHAAKFSSEVLPFSDIDVAVKSESIAEPSGISTTPKEPDLIFSFEASLKGFLVSLVDSEPSEIAVV